MTKTKVLRVSCYLANNTYVFYAVSIYSLGLNYLLTYTYVFYTVSIYSLGLNWKNVYYRTSLLIKQTVSCLTDCFFIGMYDYMYCNVLYC